MAWLLRKVDVLIAALFGVCGAAGFSQGQTYIQQYLQRLGGHMDEARRTLQEAGQGSLYADLDEASRQTVISATRGRLADIESSYRAIHDAGPATQPYEFFRHLDVQIAQAVAGDFQPALPLDRVSLVYAAVGLILGLIVYDLIKLPCGLAFRRRGSRRYRV
jgi:hypothetical protein